MKLPKKLSGYSLRVEGSKMIHRMYDTDVVVVDVATSAVTFRHNGWMTPMTVKCINKAGFNAHLVGQKRSETSRFGGRKPTGGRIEVTVEGAVYTVTASGITIPLKENYNGQA